MTYSGRFKEIKDKLRVMYGVGISKRNSAGEYRVNFFGGKEATAYYTDDLEDAFATGVSMSNRKRQTHPEHLTRNPPRKRRAKKSARRFTRKANTPKKRRQWKHVYTTERTRGLSKPRAIRAANSVIKREALAHNPTRTYLIEACVAKSLRSIKYMWWNDSEQKFTDKKAQASPYKSEHAARIEAKKLLPRLPSIVRTLRTIPA